MSETPIGAAGDPHARMKLMQTLLKAIQSAANDVDPRVKRMARRQLWLLRRVPPLDEVQALADRVANPRLSIADRIEAIEDARRAIEKLI